MPEYDAILTAKVDGEKYSWWLDDAVALPQFTTAPELRDLGWPMHPERLAVVSLDNRLLQSCIILHYAVCLNLTVLMRESMDRYRIVFRGKFERRLEPIDDLARMDRLVFKGMRADFRGYLREKEGQE